LARTAARAAIRVAARAVRRHLQNRSKSTFTAPLGVITLGYVDGPDQRRFTVRALPPQLMQLRDACDQLLQEIQRQSGRQAGAAEQRGTP